VIKIEVTGNSIPEVADKLIAIGHSLRNTAINDADNAAREAMQAKRKTSKQIDAIMPELRDEIVFEPSVGNAPSEAASSGATEASPTATSGSEPTPTTSEPEAPAAPEVDPTYLRDLVLEVVQKRDKPIVMEILERFGIAKASQVAPEHAPELVAALLGALGK
jgi:hypothetical protein